ncbi:Non-structural maintenance of chromosome element 3 [Chaetomidium leptoderma]|uniref:Non-structural maintenance of chromosome element 3 n=1 Tax=Chaetomidium leptoderma TaxID=669021 RepID=A0AAN6VPT9_9PEZI|nr:Non-structural maintenance of chromosome element 3 [Chaetomidium leptoderma]
MPARRRHAVQDDEEEDVQRQYPQSPDDVDGDGDERMEVVGQRDETSQLIKNLVRYALACEYSRTPIRRDGIREKVLGSNGRDFKKVFAGAQKQLQATFGMQMVELPTKDRNLLTADQKRKAAKSQSQKETVSNAYVLVSTLPEAYTKPAIKAPSKVQSADGEASYIALYTMIITIITLSGGELSDPRLRRHLGRLNAAENMPGMNPNDETSPSEKTELVLQRMIRHGYLVRVTESKTTGDEDATTWHVGPRGKVEVDKDAIATFVRAVYGGSNDELEKKLQMSLKIKERKPGVPETVDEAAEEAPDGDPGPSDRRRGRRRQTEAEDEDDE